MIFPLQNTTTLSCSGGENKNRQLIALCDLQAHVLFIDLMVFINLLVFVAFSANSFFHANALTVLTVPIPSSPPAGRIMIMQVAS